MTTVDQGVSVDLFGTQHRSYETSHPWLAFTVDLNQCSYELWMLLGEARSKCEHLAGVPLRPATAKELGQVYLARGAHATTAIEGNTLSENDVRKRMDGQLQLPTSLAYQGVEVDNVVNQLRAIDRAVIDHEPLALDPARILALNAAVLAGLESELDDSTVPGKFRTHSVGVGRYRGVPAEDVPYLIDRLCAWVRMMQRDAAEARANGRDGMAFSILIVAAILVHLYIAWIHPFGDGNGRTARLVEFQLLAQSGMVPLPAANLLSDHYNRTRDRYYRELDRASGNGGNVQPFLLYAVQGLVDGLRGQITEIREQQWDVTWENYVHQLFTGPETPTTRRRKHLVLDMPNKPIQRASLTQVSPRVASEYAKTGARTLSRDINHLVAINLLVRQPGGRYLANREVILAFLPPVADLPN